MTKSMTIDRAIEVFVRGFSFTRCFTHPYIPARVGPLWVVRDAPRKNGDYRREEWISLDVAPEEVDRIARKQTRGGYVVCAIHREGEPDAPLRAGFKALGYRLNCTEPLMAHSLRPIPRIDPPDGITIERVRTQAMADLLAKAATRRQVLPEHLDDDSSLRQYVALAGGVPVGWVRSIVVRGKGWCATWCSNMHVLPPFRRRGIARAMLSRLLRDDRTHGAGGAVLSASHTGAKLYPLVGYKQIGTLLAFTPTKR